MNGPYREKPMRQVLTMTEQEIVQACEMWLHKFHPDRVTAAPVILKATKNSRGAVFITAEQDDCEVPPKIKG